MILKWQRMIKREMLIGEGGGVVVRSRQLGPTVLNGQQPGWWITPALSWVNGHHHPSPFNNVSACIVIEMSPKMEVNTKLSHLICTATFLPQAADLRDPCKRSFLNKSDIIFTDLSSNSNNIWESGKCRKTRQSSRSSIQSRLIARKETHIVFIHFPILLSFAVQWLLGRGLACGFTGWHQGSSLPILVWMKHFRACWYLHKPL